MPKINVYLPDDLAAAVREADLPVSAICQRALAEAVRATGAVRDAVDLLRSGADPRDHPHAVALLASRTTPRLRRVLGRAVGLAGEATPEHLLVGLLDEPDNFGTRVLAALGADVPGLRAAAARAVGVASAVDEAVPAGDDELLDGLSAAARATVATAMEAATAMGQDFLGCEHLLLALAEPTEGAGQLLRSRGVSPDGVRRVASGLLAAASAGLGSLPADASPGAARLDAIERRLDALEARVTDGGF